MDRVVPIRYHSVHLRSVEGHTIIEDALGIRTNVLKYGICVALGAGLGISSSL